MFGLNLFSGVTTGFGGSADTRTQAMENLQRSCLQHLQIGVLTEHDRGLAPADDIDAASHAMPRSWVKGTILIRCNTVSRGHSAVCLNVIESLNSLISKGITPVVPLRGSISASGDLSPLSYIAGTVTGNPDIMVQVGYGQRSMTIPANRALEAAGIQPVVLGPKEGLGLLNGTATSAAVGSLALFDSHNLVLLSQVLTSMSVEALLGSYGSFHPFIAQIRPHKGQVEAAANIRFLLQGSQFARGLDVDDSRNIGLYQDRYPLRTSSQWLGPQLEDLLLAQKQIVTELNSTTDNPLIDVAGNHIHHGGNFQATSVTSAMEKSRLALQMVGKLLFAQCSEIINPMLNNGLPPNLAADEPSLSYTCKGIDTSMAAYMSEVAFLANPVSSHVQSAEMHNQAVNSLALISARYTLQASEIVTLMAAAHLFVLCQALDLRAMLANFFLALKPALDELSHRIWAEGMEAGAHAELNRLLWQHIVATWSSKSTLDSHDRADHVAASSLSVLTTYLISLNPHPKQNLHYDLAAWKYSAQSTMHDIYTTTRSLFFDTQNTPASLGRGANTVYTFIRHDLGVPFHRGLSEYPRSDIDTQDGRERRNIGSWISVIHASIRSGRLYRCILDLKREEGHAEPNGVNGGATTEKSELVNGAGTTLKRELVNGGLQRHETPDVVTAMANGHTAA